MQYNLPYWSSLIISSVWSASDKPNSGVYCAVWLIFAMIIGLVSGLVSYLKDKK